MLGRILKFFSVAFVILAIGLVALTLWEKYDLKQRRIAISECKLHLIENQLQPDEQAKFDFIRNCMGAKGYALNFRLLSMCSQEASLTEYCFE